MSAVGAKADISGKHRDIGRRILRWVLYVHPFGGRDRIVRLYDML